MMHVCWTAEAGPQTSHSLTMMACRFVLHCSTTGKALSLSSLVLVSCQTLLLLVAATAACHIAGAARALWSSVVQVIVLLPVSHGGGCGMETSRKDLWEE